MLQVFTSQACTLLNQDYSSSCALSCTAQCFAVFDPILKRFLTRRTTESSNLVWTPSSGSSAKITSKCFHPVRHLFSEGEGKQLFEQGPQPDSWTPARCSQPGCCGRPQLSRPDPALAVADRDPQIAYFSSSIVHTGLCLAQAFPKRSSESWSYMCLCIRALDHVCVLQCPGMPGCASSLLSAILILPGEVTSQSFVIKQLELFRPPSWRQTSLWPQRLPARVYLISSGGVACEVPPLAWPVGPGVLAHRFHAGAALKSLRGLFFLLIARLYDSVLALCQSLCQCECYCRGPYIYFTDENVEC